jgi:hypothetical protein
MLTNIKELERLTAERKEQLERGVDADAELAAHAREKGLPLDRTFEQLHTEAAKNSSSEAIAAVNAEVEAQVEAAYERHLETEAASASISPESAPLTQKELDQMASAGWDGDGEWEGREEYAEHRNFEQLAQEGGEARIYDKTPMTPAERAEFAKEYNEYLERHSLTQADIDEMARYFEKEQAQDMTAAPIHHAADLESPQAPANTIKNLSHNVEHRDSPYRGKTALDVDVQDYGDMLKTEANSELGGKELARLAHEKGWKDIYIEGSEEFKRSAWREASSRNMDVDGYRPDAQDVTATRDRAFARGYTAEGAAQMAEAKGVQSGYGAPEMTESQKAQALKNLPPCEVLEKYPELARECAVIQAVEAMISKQITDPDIRAQLMNDIRTDVANRMDRGQDMPEVSINQPPPLQAERKEIRCTVDYEH